jgi:hypothetical protein
MNRGLLRRLTPRHQAKWGGPVTPTSLNHTSRLQFDLDFMQPRARVLLGAFTGVNWSNFTTTDVNDTVPGAYYLDHAGGAGTQHRCLLMPMPTGDFDAVLHVDMFDRRDFASAIYLTSGVTAGAGSQTGLFPNQLLSGSHRHSIGANYNNFTTYTGTVWTDVGVEAPGTAFIRVRRVTATYSVCMSVNGRIWNPWANFTPAGTNYIGFGFYTLTTASHKLAIRSFRVWAPAMPDDAIGVILPILNTYE